MKSGLRGGKPRDMATFKKGGTSRGAGAAKKGFEYAIYKKGGSIKKYQEGGALPERDPQTGTRQYASFGDWMKDLKREFGGKSEKAETPRVTPKPIEEERAEAAVSADEYRRNLPIEREALPAPRPAAPQRRMAQRAAPSTRPQSPVVPSRAAPDDEMAGRSDPRLTPEQRAAAERRYGRATLDPESFMNRLRRAIRPEEIQGRTRESMGLYQKGGTVKKAQGGSCRGMGAAQRGGKYTIK